MNKEELMEEKMETQAQEIHRELDEMPVDEFGFANLPVWELFIRNLESPNYEDWTEASTKEIAAKIMYNRLPETYKKSWAFISEDLLVLISKQ